MMKKLILALFFAICTQLVWSVDNQDQLLVPSNIELALNDLTDTAHYELVKEYALSLQKSDYDQFIARLENKRTVSSVQGLSFVILQMISMGLPLMYMAYVITYFNPHSGKNIINNTASYQDGSEAGNQSWQATRDNQFKQQVTLQDLSDHFRFKRYIIGLLAGTFILGIMNFIDSHYTITASFNVIVRLLNELKELHK